MRNSAFLEFLSTEAKHLEQAGLLRSEPLLTTPPGPTIRIGDRGLLNFATNDIMGAGSDSGRVEAPYSPGAPRTITRVPSIG